MEKGTLFWDVDTQFDFMQPQGKLYVPGAETIIPKVSEARRFALDNGYSMIADIDWHSPDNDEISDTPDFKQTFPPHCMAGEPGSERVGFLGELPIEYVQIDRMSTDALRKLTAKRQFHIVIRKNSLDVFSNPNTDKLVELIAPKKVVVFGVALEFCVYYVVRGLARRPDSRRETRGGAALPASNSASSRTWSRASEPGRSKRYSTSSDRWGLRLPRWARSRGICNVADEGYAGALDGYVRADDGSGLFQEADGRERLL